MWSFWPKACTATRVQTARQQNPCKALQSISSTITPLPAQGRHKVEELHDAGGAEAAAASSRASLSVSVTRAAVWYDKECPSKCLQQSDPHLTLWWCISSVSLQSCVQPSHGFPGYYSCVCLKNNLSHGRVRAAIYFVSFGYYLMIE